MTPGRSLRMLVLLPLLLAAAQRQETWLSPADPRIRLVDAGQDRWQVQSEGGDEFTLESVQHYDAKPGDTFELNLGIRVGIDTKALPELVCRDAAGREIPVRSALLNAP